MKLNIAAIQIDVIPGQIERNLDRAIELMGAAVDNGAEVLVLPEMFATGFELKHINELAQDEHGEIVRRLCSFARQNHVMVAGGSIMERRADRFYNTMFVMDQRGEVVAKYSKSHLFESGLSEHKYITKGDDIVTFMYRRGGESARISAVICFDLKFEICRNIGLYGTQILCVPAYWPAQKREQFILISRARAYESGYYVVAANATNNGSGFASCGYSAIIDPMGNIIDGAGNEECFLIAEADTEFSAKNRMANFSKLRRAVVDDVRGISDEEKEALWH